MSLVTTFVRRCAEWHVVRSMADHSQTEHVTTSVHFTRRETTHPELTPTLR